MWTDWRAALVVVRPETVIAWHRQAFRLFWTWRSRRHSGRPTVPADVRALIRTMSATNPLWSAPRIHGELLKLEIEIGQSSVGQYMVRRGQPPSQTWRTFLANHIGQVVAADLFVVPTATASAWSATRFGTSASRRRRTFPKKSATRSDTATCRRAAFDSDSKLIVSWCVGRDAGTAYEFMQDVASRISTRIQMTTDRYRKYIRTVEDAFGTGIDYAMLTKMYGKDVGEDTRYSPAKVLGVTTEVIEGNPDPHYISRSYVERQNLTMRMHMRGLTRRTNAFSKKLENHTWQPWRCTSCATISCAFTRRCASRQRWKRASRITCGLSKNWRGC